MTIVHLIKLHIMKYYAAIRSEELRQFAAAWMKLQGKIMSEEKE